MWLFLITDFFETEMSLINTPKYSCAAESVPNRFTDYCNVFHCVYQQMKLHHPQVTVVRPTVDLCCLKVITNQIFSRGHLDYMSIKYVSNYETIVNLLLAHMCSKLEKKQLGLVVNLLLLLNIDGRLESLLPNCGFPKKVSDWRRRCMDGTHSIRAYLPSMKVISLKSHAVIDPRHAIEEMMSCAVLSSGFFSQSHSTNDHDKKTSSLSLARQCCIIPLGLFSDGYNTSNTAGLSDRSGSWSMFLCLLLDQKKTFVCNRMIAVGSGKASHDEVFDFVLPRSSEYLKETIETFVGNVGRKA